MLVDVGLEPVTPFFRKEFRIPTCSRLILGTRMWRGMEVLELHIGEQYEERFFC